MTPTWESVLKDAQKQTDDVFASRVSSLTRLTDTEIKEITPTAPDKEKLAKLMSIVADATLNNNAKAQQIKAITGLLEVAVPLLKKLL
jgi:hypothetical protein